MVMSNAFLVEFRRDAVQLVRSCEPDLVFDEVCCEVCCSPVRVVYLSDTLRH